MVTNLPSRGLHSAIFAFIGAMGFLASAVLPPDAYLVSTTDHIIPITNKRLIKPASLRMSHRSSKWSLRLHPPTARLALIEPTLHSRSGPSHSTKCLIRGPRPNSRSMDLQEQRRREGIPDGALDQCSTFVVCGCWMCLVETVLRVEK